MYPWQDQSVRVNASNRRRQRRDRSREPRRINWSSLPGVLEGGVPWSSRTGSMAMVNMNNLLNGKDSRWLQLEVCREFQRNKCTRPDTECKFAHPPFNVEVQNGRVTACYDSIKVINHCINRINITRLVATVRFLDARRVRSSPIAIGHFAIYLPRNA